MTRIAGAADLHVDARHLTSLDDQQRALYHVVDELIDRKVKLLALAGDVFNTNRPSPAAIAVLGAFLEALEKAGIAVVIAKGNHDPDAAEILRWFRGAVLVPSTPSVLRDIAGVDVAVLPWLPDRHVRAEGAGAIAKEEVAAQLSFAARSFLSGFRVQRRPGVPMLLVAHATVAGSETPTGWNMGWVPGTHWVIPAEDLAEFDASCIGHVHKRQAFGRVIVPGSLLPLDFSETEERGIVVTELPNPHEQPWEFVRIPTPQVCTFDVVGVRAEPHDVTVEQLVDDAANYVDAGSLIRVRAHVDEATAREYPPARIERALLEAGARKVQVELDVVRPDRVRDEDMTTELLPLTAVGRYLAQRVDLPDATRRAIVGAATTVITDVLEDPEGSATGDLRVARLEVRDFLGVAEASLDLAHVELAALVAPVGMGKSTLGADAVRFALFGVTRQGARGSERIVRQGAHGASVALELAGAAGRWRIVRKVKVDGRGRATSTLDVLKWDDAGDMHGIVEELHPGISWQPVSDGKIAAGEAAIARILGGLGDRALTAANLVVQRQANTFANARAEERKDLLAEAAGLEVYGELGLRSAKRLNETEREIDALEAQATPLRPRAEAVTRIEAEHAAAESTRAAAAAEVTRLERAGTDLADDVERATERAAAYEKAFDAARRLHGEAETLKGERQELEHKADVAREMLARRAELERAQAHLAAVRAEIAGILETERRVREAATARERERSAAIEKREALGRALQRARADRERALAAADASLIAAERQRDDLAASGCLERCTHVEACTVRSLSASTGALIAELTRDRERLSSVPSLEVGLEAELAAVKVPEPMPVQERTVVLDEKRRKERDLEAAVQVAEKIAAAEAVLKEHDQAIAKVDQQLTAKKRELGEANRLVLGFAGDPRAERDRALTRQRAIAEELRAARVTAQEEGTRAAMLAGRLEELRAAARELEDVEGRLRTAAAAAAAWKELIVAWRACRVMVLETSVIPAVEDTANEVLRRFPYGLQLRLVTQRERKSGDGMAETLDIEVLGGKAPFYELLSGGQQMAVDVALHLAIAVVVYRRQRARLAYLFLDEPEGLDEPGRAAFAAIARWMHETFGGTTLVASHHGDLIDQLGGDRIEIEGEPGNARAGVAAAEREVALA